MKIFVKSAGVLFLFLTPFVGASTLGECGSNTMQRAGIFEYICFGHAGEVVGFPACTPVGVPGFTSVAFGGACRVHDQCYATAGNNKQRCDLDFQKQLTEKCNLTLGGKSLRSLNACVYLAEAAYNVVDKRGCSAFATAQKTAGIPRASCTENPGPSGHEVVSTPKLPVYNENLKFIRANARTYLRNEPITIAYSGLPGSATDWITLTRIEHGPQQYGQWFYTKGERAGSMTFLGVASGEYEIRVYHDWPRGGTIIQDRIPITVNLPPEQVSMGSARLKLSRPAIENQIIEIEFEGMPGFGTDWITIVPMGASDSTNGNYVHLDGARSGRRQFSGQSAGDYEVRVARRHRRPLCQQKLSRAQRVL